MKKLNTIDEVKEMISAGKTMLLAGDEGLLSQLPDGNWIGGTIPYFMSEDGGAADKTKIFTHELPSFLNNIQTKTYDISTMSTMYTDIPENGFGIVIIPALTEAHSAFALNAPHFKDFATKPLIGWISGIHLDDLGSITPGVFNSNGQKIEDKIVVLSAQLPDDMHADIDIVNLFEQGDGDTLEFPESGFSSKTVMVNGEKQSFVEYIKKNNIDVRWPLVANYAGAMVNVSFQAVDEDNDVVNLYAPVFKGTQYRLAKPVENYASDFEKQLPSNATNITFSCNCILNYLYGELEGKKTSISGPMTFGEVAYQLLNQTMVHLSLVKN